MVNVSVVVPIYGVEKYIEKCVRSLFEQTLSDIEYIFVNDCTQDKSIIILKEIIREYENKLDLEGKTYKIINLKENGGLPHARWEGIKVASGQYIIHCDSDDWVEKDMYQLMFDEAQRTNADMVVCDYFTSDGKKNIPHKAFRKDITKEMLYKLMFSQRVPWVVWNKMIKAKYYKDCPFNVPTQTHGEDMAFIMQLLYYMDKFSYVDQPLYYYLKGSDTVTHSQAETAVVKRFHAAVNNAKNVEQFYSGKDVNNTIKNGIVYIKMANRNKLVSLLYKDKYFDMWLNTFPEINNMIFKNPDILLKHKIKYFLLRYRLMKFSK